MNKFNSRVAKVALAAGIPALLGCQHNNQPSTPGTVLGELGPDWKCTTLPTSFDAPGAVIRVAPDGAAYSVSLSDLAKATERSDFPDLTAKQTNDLSAGILATLLKIPISANASAEDKYQVKEIFGGAAEIDTTDDDIAPVLAEFNKRTDVKPDNKYYVIRKAVTATKLQYDFDKDITASFGANVKLKIFEVTPNAKYNDTNNFTYDATFKTPVNVCLQSEQITFSPSPPQAPAAAVKQLATQKVTSDTPLFTACALGGDRDLKGPDRQQDANGGFNVDHSVLSILNCRAIYNWTEAAAVDECGGQPPSKGAWLSIVPVTATGAGTQGPIVIGELNVAEAKGFYPKTLDVTDKIDAQTIGRATAIRLSMGHDGCKRH